MNSKKLQTLSQVIFLALFLILLSRGLIQIWVALFVLSMVGALFLGRFYCGWICPIQTLMRLPEWLREKSGGRALKAPSLFNRPGTRVASLGIFFALFAFSMVTGRRLPVLPALVVAGVALTLFFPASLWHRHLCPYGTLLSLPGKHSRRGLTIIQEDCISCGACREVCPAEAIITDGASYRIDQANCLLCMRCTRACPSGCIQYS